jgi:cysteine synthase A
MMIAASMLDLVASMPRVRIRGAWLDRTHGRASVWAKVEHLNPGSSVEDRISRATIEDAEAGIGLAWVCAVKGYRLVLTMPGAR